MNAATTPGRPAAETLVLVDEPPSTTVVGADEQSDVELDVDRWRRLAAAVLRSEAAVGELTLTFVDRDEIAALNREHMGADGPTDVLSFPLDTNAPASNGGVPVLLGDVVVCPAVAAEQSRRHAGSLDDELALLVVHGVLHVLGHDHADAEQAARMQARERALLERHHWCGPAPPGFRQDAPDDDQRSES
jgi:probable rRNA maturation factor